MAADFVPTRKMADLVDAHAPSEQVLPLQVGHLAPLAHDLHAQHEAVDGLVALEQAARHVGVRGQQRLVQQRLQPHGQVVVLLRRVDGGVEQLGERAQSASGPHAQENQCHQRLSRWIGQ